jgi:hypothetical protein
MVFAREQWRDVARLQWGIAIVTIVLLGLLQGSLGGSVQPAATQRDSDREHPEMPVLCICRTNLPGDVFKGQTQSVSLQIAVWADGVVIYANQWDRPGEQLRVGKLTDKQVSDVIAALREDNFFGIQQRSYRFLSTPRYWYVYGRDGESENVFSWDEIISPRYGMNGQLDNHYRDFVRVWFSARVSACGALPLKDVAIDVAASGDYNLHGYDIDHPNRTPWIEAIVRKAREGLIVR